MFLYGLTDLKVAGHATGLSRNFKMQACPACRDPVLKSTESAFDGHESRPESPLPVAEQLGKESIAFLVHPTIDEAMMTEIATLAAEIFSKAAMTPL